MDKKKQQNKHKAVIFHRWSIGGKSLDDVCHTSVTSCKSCCQIYEKR